MYKRKRIAFFTYTQWAFGTIHSALCKELFRFGIDADIIDWSLNYTWEDFQNYNDIYDIFVTTPEDGCNALLTYLGIPSEKIIVIAHGNKDLDIGKRYSFDFTRFLKYATISKSLTEYSSKLQINRVPVTLRNGITFDRFYMPVASSLNKLGYAGTLTHFNLDNTLDCKRSILAKRLSDSSNIPISYAAQKTFITMPNFYKTVDAVIVSSDHNESCSLPLMEAAAAGRLPISARMGITCEFDNPPGIILPMDEEGFVSHGTQILNELKQDTNKFTSLCADAQDFARQHYDWSAVIEDWADLILS